LTFQVMDEPAYWELGIDEAGRGPILGPMVMAAVYASPEQIARLVELGVKDSKRFTGKHARRRRSELADAIRGVAGRVAVRVILPARIDAENLGVIERNEALEMIRQVRPVGRILFDGQAIFGKLARRLKYGEARDRAESAFPVVAAASIVAKAERDRLFLEISAKYEAEFGPLQGWGYNNEGSYGFIERYRVKYGRPPEEMRKKWGSSFEKVVDIS
jgi:ribonuclease HII